MRKDRIALIIGFCLIILTAVLFSCGDDDDDDDEALCSDTCEYLNLDCLSDCSEKYNDNTECKEQYCDGLADQDFQECIDQCTEPLDQCSDSCENGYDSCMSGC